MSELILPASCPTTIHQLDHVEGTHHFEVPISEGIELMEALHATLPGYMVPRYVQERHGDAGKTILTSQECECQEAALSASC